MFKDSLNLANLTDAALQTEEKYNRVKEEFADSLDQVKTAAKVASDRKVDTQRLKSRDRLIWIFVIVLLLGTIGVYFLVKNNRLIKKQHTLVNNQKSALHVQHKEITDSITYAQRIQDAIMVKEGEWQKITDEHFILFKPKDVVSGDFYWAYNNTVKTLSIWAVADCTGHGVPGAFMSMLGTGFLNEIVIENRTTDPGEILTKLRSKIITALTQRGEAKTKDGMDISICVWDKENAKILYAGANNPLWIIRHKDSEKPENVKRVVESTSSALNLLEIAPDKMPVGYQSDAPQPFTTKEIKVFSGDVLILLSDGFPDQFGGKDGKKYKSAPLKKKFIEWQEQPFEKQKELLESEFDSWKGTNEQVDDVCIAVIRIKS
jgi:serine phosphatase RsbU (regulator of sigma subunit)